MNEHLLNVYASRAAKGHTAAFLGFCEVSESQATTRLTSGLWLVGCMRTSPVFPDFRRIVELRYPKGRSLSFRPTRLAEPTCLACLGRNRP